MTTHTPSSPSIGGFQARHTNRLNNESSPYLLQHVHNPVDWYAWGSAAFDAARQSNKPIFLSIGYSTCYWCHVMERESFESQEIAAFMNEHFINIKVDREERPDVDDIYMAAVQLLSGHGGWPMSVFLEPQSLKPFAAGTYFPPRDSYGRPGLPSVLRQIAKAWTEQREAVMKQADQVADAVRGHLSRSSAPIPVGARQVERAIAELMASYDPKDGGFAGSAQRAPKFPTPVYLDSLIGAAWDSDAARKAALHTLDRMATGGMYDQIGGGFHRYSTDEKWLVPHFEKMLYDQGQLVSTYARAYELTGDPLYAQVIRETLDYVLREMMSPQGAFYSARDAEVNGREGANYLWNPQEVHEALAAAGLGEELEFALELYGFNGGPNFRDPHHGDEPPKNVLYLEDKPQILSRGLGLALDQFTARRDKLNRALLHARNQRDQPRLDDKVIAGWNGLMIAGFADGGRVLHEQSYVDAAATAARFILHSMRRADGGLLRTSRNGQAKIDAFLEDYAFLIHGLIALQRATSDRQFRDNAVEIASLAKDRFWDAGEGGYFDTMKDQSDLFVRIKSVHDGAIPAGNSVMLLNLLDLHDLTRDETYLDDAAATLKSVSASIYQHPTASIFSALGLKRMLERHADRLGFASSAPQPSRQGRSPVHIQLHPAEIAIGPELIAKLEVQLRIEPSYHINAHEPGDSSLVPLKIDLTGVNGLTAKIKYPCGEKYEHAHAESGGRSLRVHTGTVVVGVELRQVGPITGEPQLAITYQACTDTECLAPETETLLLRMPAAE